MEQKQLLWALVVVVILVLAWWWWRHSHGEKAYFSTRTAVDAPYDQRYNDGVWQGQMA